MQNTAYKTIWMAYLNTDRKFPDKKYLAVKNMSEEPITIQPGESIYLNMVPKDVRDRFPKMPLFKKSVPVTQSHSHYNEDPRDVNTKELAGDVPF